MTRLLRALLPWLLLLCAGAALAHKPSDSYLALDVTEGRLSGRWDIALRDLDFAIGLDADGDGAITWGELRARHAEIAGYAAARLAVSLDGQPCTLQVGAQQVDRHTDGAYSVLPLQLGCPAAGAKARLDLAYTLFAELDPQHRGLLVLTVDGATRTAILGPHEPRQGFDLQASSRLEQGLHFLRDGIWHIWIGFDHILFLLALLLPAVGHWPRPGAPWQPVTRFSQAFWDVVRVVTAFTVAHSVTLTLATLELVSLPSRWVESSIAASVVLAALNNIWPVIHGRRWVVAFAFGLIHGFGFASVLGDLGLPQGALVLALLGFNVGVELGQLVIVAAFLPLAYTLRQGGFYRHAVLHAGSALIAAVAMAWLVERVFDLQLMPF